MNSRKGASLGKPFLLTGGACNVLFGFHRPYLRTTKTKGRQIDESGTRVKLQGDNTAKPFVISYMRIQKAH
jgi:hypothetical protein